MSIKSQGGVFGRNPTFNDVEVDGTLTVGGNSVPDASTILVDGDIGSTVQGYDVDTAKYDDTTANFTGTLQNGGSNVVVDSDIGSTVQAYDADTAKLDANQTWTGTQAFNGAFVDVYKEAQGGYATFRAYGPSGQILWANGGTSTSYLDSDTIVFRKSFSSGNAEHARFNTSGNLAFPSGKASTSLPPLALAQANCSMTMKRGRGRRLMELRLVS
jgi:hypothetical protein